MSHWKSQLTNYHGSKVLLPLAQSFRIQVDKLNFLVAGLAAIGLAYVYSYVLDIKRASVRTRKVTLIVFGFGILYFCFGRDYLHVVAEAAAGYVLMRCVPIDKLPQVTLITSLGYQSILHISRQYSDPGGYTIDITGAIMMLTQRVTTVAFSVRDGVTTNGLTWEQARDAITERPDALSYFAYMFDFHVLLAGPLVPYKALSRITEGKNLRPDGSIAIKHIQVASKLVWLTVSVALILLIAPVITERNIVSNWYSSLPIYYKILYLLVYGFLCRLQYYIAWKLAEAACSASGYGYYMNSDGEECWDGADNINIFRVETATSLKVLIDNWNVSTQRWLKHTCYERNVSHKIFRTFFLSALWHGLYPGYFLAFMTALLFVISARQVRYYLRPILLMNGYMPKWVYDVVTWHFTSLFLAYSMMPFVLLEYDKAIYLWRELYFFGHILAPLAFTLHLFFIRRSSRSLSGISLGVRETLPDLSGSKLKEG
ncbi:membrane-bound O-acyltransferase domain-containing protein 2-like [Tropilaelaps mercedesae]|uniref:Membrane-bound O-acyltransferase domain-containing protein 2-like n=1 Tax=Tropilaelaps mercedesae TaxID=418985 RepID=A0A1V9X7U4_9ACAR|nr:membrane-bound O-acyltransferase domain-containing protein 2-like [Tropilaelaps mercedesae]